MENWISKVQSEFDLNLAVDTKSILDIARVVAHSVERPAAPVTTFLMGIALAKGANLETLVTKIEQLASEWPSQVD